MHFQPGPAIPRTAVVARQGLPLPVLAQLAGWLPDLLSRPGEWLAIPDGHYARWIMRDVRANECAPSRRRGDRRPGRPLGSPCDLAPLLALNAAAGLAAARRWDPALAVSGVLWGALAARVGVA